MKRANSDIWSAPGGKMEKDETQQQCVIREVQEETGITLDNPKQLKSFALKLNRGLCYWFHTFEQRFDTQPTVTLNNEHTEYKWVTLKEALTYNLIEDEDVCLIENYPELN